MAEDSDPKKPALQAKIREAFLDSDGDTAVDPLRARRRRIARANLRHAEEEKPPPAPTEDYLGERGDAGATLSQSALNEVRVREAIVRRNHRIDQAERTSSRGAPPKSVIFVKIDWLRTRDTGLKIERKGADRFCLSGIATGTVPGQPGTRPGSGPTQASVSLGVDGVGFTQPVHAGASAAECVALWVERLSVQYEVEVGLDGETAQVRLVRPLSFG